MNEDHYKAIYKRKKETRKEEVMIKTVNSWSQSYFCLSLQSNSTSLAGCPLTSHQTLSDSTGSNHVTEKDYCSP